MTLKILTPFFKLIFGTYISEIYSNYSFYNLNILMIIFISTFIFKLLSKCSYYPLN